jgi:hypothetical protein
MPPVVIVWAATRLKLNDSASSSAKTTNNERFKLIKIPPPIF